MLKIPPKIAHISITTNTTLIMGIKSKFAIIEIKENCPKNISIIGAPTNCADKIVPSVFANFCGKNLNIFEIGRLKTSIPKILS